VYVRGQNLQLKGVEVTRQRLSFVDDSVAALVTTQNLPRKDQGD
jgi:hypothetical protein